MNFHRESQREEYDVVVVGSGIGGLSAAALLARAGKSVLVVERHDRPGGYAHSFHRKRYHFDSCVHLTSGCGLKGFLGGQIIFKLLNSLNVYDEIDFISIDPYSQIIYPDLEAHFRQGSSEYVTTLAQIFPEQQQALSRFLKLSQTLTEQASMADDIKVSGNMDRMYGELTVLSEYRRATLSEILDHFFNDFRLKSILATHWPYLGLPPSQVSFLYWSMMHTGYTVDGAYYCKGTFQNFADTLVHSLTKTGGEVLFNIGVRRIHVEDGRTTGVTLDHGQRIRSPVVISNADLIQTVQSLVGEEKFPSRFVKRLSSMTESLSAFVVYLAIDKLFLESAAVHESFYYASYDHEENFSRTKAGEITWFSATIPTLADPELAPPGEHVMLLTTLLPFDIEKSWRVSKSNYTETMLDLAEKYFPGLKNNLLFVEAGSPRTMERYTLNRNGASYGWDLTPRQVGANRLMNQSPLAGLYFAGHWSAPGGGIYGVTVSGVQTAQKILGIEKQDEFWARIAG